MSKVLLALTSAALLALSGCAEVQTKPAEKPAAAAKPAAAKPAEAKPTISAEAQAALSAAQADVKAAKAKNALWTTAEDALEAAEAAAEKGDSATVLSQSRLVSDHVKKGMAQLNYPMLKVGD
jgi:murein lipoprotein